MKNLIKRNSRLFGLILLLGIVCGVYLAFFVIGHLIYMVSPVDPHAAEHPVFTQLFMKPVVGMFSTSCLVLACYLTALIGYLIKTLFVGTWNSINSLGQWLVKQTSGGIQEG